MTSRRFDVVYLWRGERHRLVHLGTYVEVMERVRELRADGWVCWVEEVTR
jgi:hypothetical protein